MLIRIKQVRRLADGKGFGTDVELGRGLERHTLQFRPLDPKNPEADHVCDIDDQQDIATLLAIPAGFEIHASQIARKKPPAAAGTTAATKAAGEGNGNGSAKAYADMTRDELLVAVAEKTGRKPSPATAKKKLLELLTA